MTTVTAFHWIASLPAKVRKAPFRSINSGFYGTFEKVATPKKPNYRLNLTKIAHFSLIQHQPKSEPNASDLNERERG